jgi:hypothetical protein
VDSNSQHTLWEDTNGNISHNTGDDGRLPHKKSGGDPKTGVTKGDKNLPNSSSDPKTALTKGDKIPPPPPEALERGLVATWSRVFGYVSIHDPLTGSWHDLPTDDAPRWALGEAGTRKTLWRMGDRDTYAYTSKEMAAIWERERPVPFEEGIVEEHTEDLD